ncbi:MANSC domain-containing protein 1 [Ornithorhynchus anatinus]|uniref:MANSC domain containing 1 n=1 Tax=Ornithorhynchus anatinus TaxID=9258 RepID=K7EG39_ORNAN|nr:MANSC domain-containing protein 1 [Ornithorhynchus anatinus]
MTCGVPWALALAVLAGLGPEPPVAGQSCPVEKREGVVVDIQAAFSRGIRSSEPEYSATEEACLHACCLAKNISGDKECNLIIFDTRKTRNQQNCYLFYCPSEEACPMKPARGLVSYRRIRDFPPSDNTDLPNKNASSEAEPVGVKSSVAPAATSDPQHPPEMNSTGVLWEEESSKTSGLPDASRKRWEETDRNTQIPPYGKTVDGLGSSQEQERADLLPPNGSLNSTATAHSHPNTPTSTPTPPPPPQTTGSGAPPLPPPPSQTPGSALTSTPPPLLSAPARNPTPRRLPVPSQTPVGIPGPGSGGPTPLTATVPPLSPTAAGPLRLSPTPAGSSATPTPPGGRGVSETAGSVTAADPGAENASPSDALATSAVQPVDPWGSGEAGPGPSLPVGASVDGSGLRLDKWALLGALVAGVSFLAVGIAILGRKLLESLRRKRYSRLDYLINGIYMGI